VANSTQATIRIPLQAKCIVTATVILRSSLDQVLVALTELVVVKISIPQQQIVDACEYRTVTNQVQGRHIDIETCVSGFVAVGAILDDVRVIVLKA